MQGGSGEKGCYQYMPGEFDRRAKIVLGYTIPFTQVNEEYITVLWNQRLLNQGLTANQIALLHNQGNLGQCNAGKSFRFGKWVYWDSCDYVKKFKAIYATL